MNNRYTGKYLVKPGKSPEIHRAGWIIVNPWHVIENGSIATADGRIQDIVKAGPGCSLKPGCIDHGPGVLMAPLVNAHTHLELSYFKGRVDMSRGFKAWVKDLLELREKTSPEIIMSEACRAGQELYNSGVLWAGEVSTTGVTKEIFQNSSLYGVWFQEFLGSENSLQNNLSLENKYLVHGKDISFSLAGHAPHTTSPDLLKKNKKRTDKKKLPFSIHVSESMEEMEFIRTCKGRWAQFLKSRSIDFSSWNLPEKSPVIHLMNLGLLDPLTLLVHVLNVNDRDLKIIAESGAKVCVCPRSNMGLHGTLPELEKMFNHGIRPALGTDSLASSESLSIFDEMKFISENYRDMEPCQILAMATQYGADVLGAGSETGSLEPGKRSDMLYIPCIAETEKEVMKKITGHG